jgi:hypothetical protein
VSAKHSAYSCNPGRGRFHEMSEPQSTKSTLIGRKPKIFYRAWSHNRPTGGQKQMYRHVDILNSAGFDAYIFHDNDGFRLTWFENL